MTTRPFRPGIPADILALSQERDLLRRKGQYDRADMLKQKIEDAGYLVKDNPHGAHLVILPSINVDGTEYRLARHMPSLLEAPDRCMFSVNILAQNTYDQTRRCIESVLLHAGNADIEIVLVDNASQDGLDLWVEALKYNEPRLHLVRTSRKIGIAEARNLGLKRSQGRYIVALDTNVELTGDIFTPLQQTFSDEEVGLTGVRGLQTEDLRHFEESHEAEVDAIDNTCLVFRRHLLTEAGLFDERYRFPYFMDIDFSFALRDCGFQAVLSPDLPLEYHPSTQEASISDAERTRLTKRNFYRFLEKWGDREDLILNFEEYEDEDEDEDDEEEA